MRHSGEKINNKSPRNPKTMRGCRISFEFFRCVDVTINADLHRWVASIGLDDSRYGIHTSRYGIRTMHRTKVSLKSAEENL